MQPRLPAEQIAVLPDPVLIGAHWVFADGSKLLAIRGGDGPVEPTPIVRPEGLEAFTVDQLREFHGTVTARIAELAAQDLTFTVAQERQRLTALANEVGAMHDTAVSAAAEEPAPLAPIAAPAEPAPLADAPVVEPPADAPVVEPPVADLPPAEQLAHAAAASLTVDDVTGAPATPPPSGDAPPAQEMAVFTAAASVGNIATLGQVLTFEDMIGVISGQEAETVRMARDLGPTGTIPEAERKAYVASITLRGELPREMVLHPHNGAQANTALIEATPFPEAVSDPMAPRTAAVCGPADIIRAIPECIGMGRNIRAMFRNVPSMHAAFQFIPSIGLASVAAGVTQWTDEDQALVDPTDPDTWKPCVALTCGTPETVTPERVPSCLTVEVMQNMSTPEQVANWVSVIHSQTERVAEGVLLDTIDTNSSQYTVTTAFYGAMPSLFDAVSNFLGLAGSLNRQLDLSGYQLIVEGGMVRRLALDDIARIFRVENELQSVLGSLGVGLVQTPDWGYAAGSSPWGTINPVGHAPIELPAAPCEWTCRLIDPRSGFFFSPDDFAWGTYRDPQLMRQNQIQWFGELFEGLGKNGCAPWFSFTIVLDPNGDRDFGSSPLYCPDNGGGSGPGLSIADLSSGAVDPEVLTNPKAAKAKADAAAA